MSKIVTFVLISIVIILGTYLFKKNGFNTPQLCCDPFLRVKIPFLLLNAPQLAAIGIFTLSKSPVLYDCLRWICKFYLF